MTNKAPSVFIAVPSGDNVATDFCFSFSYLMMHAQKLLAAGIISGLSISNFRSSLLPLSRQRLAQEAVDSGSTHVLWIDSDSTIPQWSLQRLLSLDLDICGASFRKKKTPEEPTTAKIHETHYKAYVELTGNEPFEVDFIGCGLLLVKTDVYRKLEKPWYQIVIRAVREAPDGLHAWGEDDFFCEQARQAGFRIHCDPVLSRWSGHVGQQVYSFTSPENPEHLHHEFMNKQGVVTLDEALTVPDRMRVVRDRRL